MTPRSKLQGIAQATFGEVVALVELVEPYKRPRSTADGMHTIRAPPKREHISLFGVESKRAVIFFCGGVPVRKWEPGLQGGFLLVSLKKNISQEACILGEAHFGEKT